jgi:hypothetical protein
LFNHNDYTNFIATSTAVLEYNVLYNNMFTVSEADCQSTLNFPLNTACSFDEGGGVKRAFECTIETLVQFKKDIKLF